MATLTRLELQAMATHDVIEGRDLRARGVTTGQLRVMLRRGHLFRAHRDVYLVSDRPSIKGLWLAAVLHCGPGALLSHDPAGVLWELVDEWDGWAVVTVPNRRITKPPAGIRVYRSRRPDTGWTRDGIPVTTLFRTIDDLARNRTDSALKAIVGRGERKHALALDELYACATSSRLRRVLATYVAGRGMTDSELEARFFDIAATTTLDRPEMQRKQAGGRVDFLWPALNLIVEVDGFGTHGGEVAFKDDRDRDRAHWRAGRVTLRYTWSDVVLRPREIAADLELAASRAK